MYFAHISQTGVVKYGQVPSSIGVLEAPKSPCRSARPTALPGMSTGSRFGRCGSASKNSPADGSSSIVSSSRHSEAASNLYERWAFWSVMPRSSGWNWTIQDMHQFGDSCLCCTGRCNTLVMFITFKVEPPTGGCSLAPVGCVDSGCEAGSSWRSRPSTGGLALSHFANGKLRPWHDRGN